MKKYLERFLIVILCMLILLPNVCYADVVVIPSASEILIPVAFVGTMIILAIIIIISLASILILKTTVKQTRLDDTMSNEYRDNIAREYNEMNEDGREKVKESNNKINKNEKRIYKCLLIFAFLLSLLVAGYLEETATITGILIITNAILIILSIIFRGKKNKKVSYIICFIAFLVIGILAFINFITDKKIESYNNQFLQYIETEEYRYSYVSDIDGLITTAINNNNKNEKKISLIYLNSTYTTQSELEELLSIVDTSSKYVISIERNSEYIESITLLGELIIDDEGNLYKVSTSTFNSKLTPYIGKSIAGSQVNALLQYCLSNNMKATQTGETYKYITVTCTYKNNGQIETMELNGESESYTKVPTGTYYTVLGKYDSNLLMTTITVTQNE